MLIKHQVLDKASLLNISLVQLQFRIEVHDTASSSRLGFELMTSRSWPSVTLKEMDCHIVLEV